MPDILGQLLLGESQPLVLLLLANLFLFFFAPWIVGLISGGSDSEEIASRTFRINLMRALNFLAVVIIGITLFTGKAGIINNFLVKVLLALVIAYVGVISSQLLSRTIRMRYGRRIQSQGSLRIADTYASRALSISAGVFISIVVLISIVRLFGFDNLLETGGVIGLVGVFLALTQGAWAPDIISGLVILNTRMFDERDVVKLGEGANEIIARVHRTRAFHTELLNLVDNHRIMIRNSRIRDYTVHNLSKFATARGLRESLRFKIGYNVAPQQVRQLFSEVFNRACENNEIPFEQQYEPEVRLQDAGDHAVEWSFHYYTKDADSIVKQRQMFRELVLDVATEMGIDLSTPLSITTADVAAEHSGGYRLTAEKGSGSI